MMIAVKSNPRDIDVVFILCNFDASSLKLVVFELLVKLQQGAVTDLHEYEESFDA